MIFEIILIVVFAVIFNWSVNLQILSHIEKNKNEKLVQILLAFLAALILGFLSRG